MDQAEQQVSSNEELISILSLKSLVTLDSNPILTDSILPSESDDSKD